MMVSAKRVLNGKKWAGLTAIMSDRETFNSDLRLMELAARNPSLGGRELLQEIIERGPAREETERPQARELIAALASQEPDHPDYRTPVEQANWLGEESRVMRDLYEHGAELKGDILIVPAEEHELSEERDTPFITTLSYALQKIDDREQAREFHSLGLAISGETADARTQIAVFKTYYDRIARGEREERFRKRSGAERNEALAQTLGEMRMLAAEMARLETRESIDTNQHAEDREDGIPESKMNTAARRINLRDEMLRMPAGLSYEQKERLVSKTIPEIDRRLERGVSREALFKAIDRTMLRPDAAEYAHKLAELTGRPEAQNPERPLSKEEYLESQQTLLRLCEHEHLHLRGLRAARAGNELEPHEETRLSQVDNLAQRLRRGIGKNTSSNEPDRVAYSRLFVSLPERGVGEGAFRLPVSSAKVFETMAKIAASEKLSLQTWSGREDSEIKLKLTEREIDERSRIGTFLKSYVNERLRDPETRALNGSVVFRDARAAMFNATTPEAFGRVASDLLRVNERRSEELRRHRAAPEKYPLPTVMPLNTQERNLLFNGRAPDHHTPEMRELRLNYGLSRSERVTRGADLLEGKVEPSEALKIMLKELGTRNTTKAVAHFQASIINEKVSAEAKVPLHLLSQRIPPHERTFLYELCEERKKDLAKEPSAAPHKAVNDESRIAELPSARAFGSMPKENRTFREYMASMGQIERQLLNKELVERGFRVERADSEQAGSGLSITGARELLPESLRREIRLRARNLAWQSLVPEEIFDRNPLPEAMRISDTVAHIQEHLLEKARIAQAIRSDFVERASPSEPRPRELKIDNVPHKVAQERRGPTLSPGIASLSPNDARKLAELDHYAAQTREEVYRAFELLDAQRRELELTRAYSQPRIQELDSSRHITPPEKFTAAENERSSALPLYKAVPVMVTRLREGEDELRPEQASLAISSTRVQTDQTWHFDNLREVLKVELNKLQDDNRGRAVEWLLQADRDISQER
jgi:hypothetical protein